MVLSPEEAGDDDENVIDVRSSKASKKKKKSRGSKEDFAAPDATTTKVTPISRVPYINKIYQSLGLYIQYSMCFIRCCIDIFFSYQLLQL